MTPPPQPLPEHLWGETWQFVTLSVDDLEQGLCQRPIPINRVTSCPSDLGLDASATIPGIIIEAGRRSLKLAQWLDQQSPIALTSVRAELNGIVLNTASGQRWILMTYADADMAAAAQQFDALKQSAAGFHFLLIQPDNSGVTQSGLWLLHAP